MQLALSLLLVVLVGAGHADVVLSFSHGSARTALTPETASDRVCVKPYLVVQSPQWPAGSGC
jgi:hypothetical protein